jgi:four helix bundle protein
VPAWQVIGRGDRDRDRDQIAGSARGMAWVKDQAQRAAGSVALNIAEGRGRAGQAQRNHYEIAYASASEACAALDLVDLPGAAEKQQELRAIGSMLVGLMR